VRFLSSTYDQENRLIRVTTANGNKIEFSYDGMSRRVETREYQANSLMLTTRYVYDGTQIVAILNAANTTVKTVTRGLDLSGSMEGAGGIGGLLGMKDGTSTASYVADGNGNIAALYGEQGESTAVYQYDGFGNKVVSNGSMSESNPFQWSSKYFHQPSGLVAYEFRFYSPAMGRWINRDPIEEAGGINLYGFVGNDPLNSIDPLGLDRWFVNAEYGLPHGFIVVEDCISGNLLRLDFGPIDGQTLQSEWDRAFPSRSLPSAAGAVCTILSRGFVASGFISITEIASVPRNSTHVESDQDADQALIRKARKGRLRPPLYSFWFYNCRHWVSENINTGIPSAPVPVSPPVPIFPIIVPEPGERGGLDDQRFDPWQLIDIIFGN